VADAPPDLYGLPSELLGGKPEVVGVNTQLIVLIPADVGVWHGASFRTSP
jgi:hypothetical protein